MSAAVTLSTWLLDDAHELLEAEDGLFTVTWEIQQLLAAVVPQAERRLMEPFREQM